MWLGLSATASILLLATSNQLTRNVAAVPFLWVLLLSLYLLSFIVSFERDRWYVRWLWAPLYVGSLLGVLHLLAQETEPDLYLQFVIYSVNLLSGCMVCHGELARRRPRTERLTSFYLYVAAGESSWRHAREPRCACVLRWLLGISRWTRSRLLTRRVRHGVRGT